MRVLERTYRGEGVSCLGLVDKLCQESSKKFRRWGPRVLGVAIGISFHPSSPLFVDSRAFREVMGHSVARCHGSNAPPLFLLLPLGDCQDPSMIRMQIRREQPRLGSLRLQVR